MLHDTSKFKHPKSKAKECLLIWGQWRKLEGGDGGGCPGILHPARVEELKRSQNYQKIVGKFRNNYNLLQIYLQS